MGDGTPVVGPAHYESAGLVLVSPLLHVLGWRQVAEAEEFGSLTEARGVGRTLQRPCDQSRAAVHPMCFGAPDWTVSRLSAATTVSYVGAAPDVHWAGPRGCIPRRWYVSGDNATEVPALFAGSNVDVRVLEGGVGTASGMKMAYAAWTKGSAALLLSARAPGQLRRC
jgi:hypothetical protein